MRRLIIIIFTALFLVPVFSVQSHAQNTATPDKVRRLVDARIVDVVRMLESGQFDQAERLLSALSELYPDYDAISYYKAEVAIMKNDAMKAVFNMTAAFRQDSTNTAYLSELARLYYVTGERVHATQCYEKLLKKNAYDVEAMVTLSSLYTVDGHLSEADSLVQKVIHYKGRSEYTDVLRMDILRRQPQKVSELLDVLSDYSQSRNVPSETKVDIVKKTIGSTLRYIIPTYQDKLVGIMDKMVEVGPTDTCVTHFTGSCYASLGVKDKLDSLLILNPEDLTLWEYSLASSVMRDDYEGAIYSMGKMLPLVASDKKKVAALHSEMGNYYFQLGQLDKAIKSCEQSLKVVSGDIPTMNNYAYFLALSGKNLEKAERISRKTVEKEPHNSTYLDTYAYILYRMKKYPLAKTYLKKALLYGGKDSPEVLEHYAAVLEAVGDVKLAQVYRDQAAKIRNER